jgi:competence protein ComEA
VFEQRRVAVISILLGLIVAVGGLVLWLRRPQPAPVLIATPEPTATPAPVPTPTGAPLRVYVTGAVHAPDVYLLAPGSIVKDAVAAAGGATDDADLARINLAIELYDQQQVYVPHQGEDAPPVSLPGAEAAAPGRAGSTVPPAKVNINTASAEELDTLPGIGPAFAQRIVDYRTEHGPFATIQDITQVKGIGPATLAEIEALITVQ